MPISKEQLDAARMRLEQDVQSIISELKDMGASPDGSIEVTHDEGFADAAQTTSERSKILSLVENLQQRLIDVKGAIERIDRGEYGICERCGNPISPERLEAIPSARLCIKDAQHRT